MVLLARMAIATHIAGTRSGKPRSYLVDCEPTAAFFDPRHYRRMRGTPMRPRTRNTNKTSLLPQMHPLPRVQHGGTLAASPNTEHSVQQTARNVTLLPRTHRTQAFSNGRTHRTHRTQPNTCSGPSLMSEHRTQCRAQRSPNTRTQQMRAKRARAAFANTAPRSRTQRSANTRSANTNTDCYEWDRLTPKTSRPPCSG